MSAGKIHGVHHIQCDGPSCHDYIEAERRSQSLQGLWQKAQTRGWTMRQKLGETAHFCRDCSEPFGGLTVVNGGRT